MRGKKQNGSSRLDKIGCCHGDGVVDNFFHSESIDIVVNNPVPVTILIKAVNGFGR